MLTVAILPIHAIPLILPVLPIHSDCPGAAGSQGAHSDHPRSRSPFAAERNVDIQHAKKGLRTPQPARESARIFCPGADGGVLTGALGTQTQQVGCAAVPTGPFAHDGAHASGKRVGFDYALDCCSAIGGVGTSESAGWPKRGFA